MHMMATLKARCRNEHNLASGHQCVGVLSVRSIVMLNMESLVKVSERPCKALGTPWVAQGMADLGTKLSCYGHKGGTRLARLGIWAAEWWRPFVCLGVLCACHGMPIVCQRCFGPKFPNATTTMCCMHSCFHQTCHFEVHESLNSLADSTQL